jgi:hypothetical protein
MNLIKCAFNARLYGDDSPYTFILDIEITKEQLESNRWWSKNIWNDKYQWVVDTETEDHTEYMEDFFNL